MGAMCAYATSYLTGSPWLGVLAAGFSGAIMGALHASICALPRVNEESRELSRRWVAGPRPGPRARLRLR